MNLSEVPKLVPGAGAGTISSYKGPPEINFKSQALLKDTGRERTPSCVKFPRQLKSSARARRSYKKFSLKICVRAQLDSVGKARGDGFDH